MQYLITFIEGVISFLSPCMLPLLPVYISFFAGEDGQKKNIYVRALAFVAGFTIVFILLGILAGTVGGLLRRYSTVVHIVCGIVVILFGLSYLEFIPLPFLKGIQKQVKVDSALSAFVFGLVYSVSLTPCVGAFLGSAMMLASVSASAVKGLLLLLVYSLGLGIPFFLSAILIDHLKDVFAFIKNHYKQINTVSGIFLIIVGLAMCFGLFDRLLGIL